MEYEGSSDFFGCGRHYGYWFNAENATAVLAAQNLVDLESFPPAWRLDPLDVIQGRTLTYDEQVGAITKIIGETEWAELLILKDYRLISLTEFYCRLCEAITRPYRPDHGWLIRGICFNTNWCSATFLNEEGDHVQ